MKKIAKALKLKDNEKIIRVIRHYFVIIIPNLVISILIIFLDFFLMFYFFSLGLWGTTMFFVILVIGAFYIIRLLFLWNRNLIVVTNKRLIDIESGGFFQHFVSEFYYDQIKSITIDVRGIMKHIFHYGDLKLKIVDQPLGFQLYNIKKPDEILELINRQINKEEKQHQNTTLNFEDIIFQVGKLPQSQKKELLAFLKSSFQNDEQDEDLS